MACVSWIRGLVRRWETGKRRGAAGGWNILGMGLGLVVVWNSVGSSGPVWGLLWGKWVVGWGRGVQVGLEVGIAAWSVGQSGLDLT